MFTQIDLLILIYRTDLICSQALELLALAILASISDIYTFILVTIGFITRSLFYPFCLSMIPSSLLFVPYGRGSSMVSTIA